MLYLTNNIAFLSLKVDFVLENSADPVVQYFILVVAIC